MRGREFLEVARELLGGGTEAHWRAATGRAYYALMLESRDLLNHWNIHVPKDGSVHVFVRFRFEEVAAINDLVEPIASGLKRHHSSRNLADYVLQHPSMPFASPRRAEWAIRDAGKAIDLLDQLNQDDDRRRAATEAIKAALPSILAELRSSQRGNRQD